MDKEEEQTEDNDRIVRKSQKGYKGGKNLKLSNVVLGLYRKVAFNMCMMLSML